MRGENVWFGNTALDKYLNQKNPQNDSQKLNESLVFITKNYLSKIDLFKQSKWWVKAIDINIHSGSTIYNREKNIYGWC